LKAIVNTHEHSDIHYPFEEKQLIEFNNYFDENNANPKYLGIHQEFEYNEVKLKSHYFIGYRWLSEDKEEYIHIAPKCYQNCRADYLKMLLECFKDSIVSKKLGDSYEIFFHEKWIEIQNEQDEITPLLILHFLKIVNNIAHKGLKKGYIRIDENLASKIKGKILINQTIKHNYMKSRIDKTVCNHQIFTVNCIENQILKTALVQCTKNLHGVRNNDISKLLKQNINAFELIETKEVFDSDFYKIKHSPFYKDYKEALKLSQMIFKRFGFSLNSSSIKYQHRIPPFYINMPELFERYVEVQIRKKAPDLIDGNRDIKFEFDMRPDFLLPSKNMIIDAKYKYWYEHINENDKFKDDYQQLSLYGRAHTIRKRIELPNDEEAKLVFIYPKNDARKDISLDSYCDSNFSKMYRIGLQIPLLKDSCQ
jgi:5-methylcytosine-specific restriction endonuclease McrBC regulatory subunit McrC